MIYDTITSNLDTNQKYYVEYFIDVDKSKLIKLYEEKKANKDDNVMIIASINTLLSDNYYPILNLLDKSQLSHDEKLLLACASVRKLKSVPLYGISGARSLMSFEESEVMNFNKEKKR